MAFRMLRWGRLLGAAVGVGFLVAAPARQARAAEAPVVVTNVRLESEQRAAGTYTYTATVFDSTGAAVRGASLDIGGLAADPDIRLTTTVMKSSSTDPTRYEATVQFPSRDDWMLVVRVHEPAQYVDVFTATITDAPEPISHHDLSANPAKRAVIAADPTFYSRYDPALVNAGAPRAITDVTVGDLTTADHAHDGTLVASSPVHGHGFDLSVTATVLLHSAAAVAWLLSVAVLALANRFGPGSARNEAVRFVSQRYRLLAGGGMLASLLTGVVMAQGASAGVLHPSRLLATATGTAYLAVFALKMLLVGVSLVTTLRLGRILAPRGLVLPRPILASLSAAADDAPDHRVRALAELNLVTGALILGCVAVLGQLHHALL